MVGPLHCNGGLPWLEMLGDYPTGQSDMRGIYLRPLFPPFQSGAGLYPGCSHFLSALICPVLPETTSSCDGTVSVAGSGGGCSLAQTTSAGQQHSGCVGYGLGWCWRWGPQTLWDCGPESVSGPPPSLVSAPGWKAVGMRQWLGSIFRWWRWEPSSSPRLAHVSVSILRSRPEVVPGRLGTLPMWSVSGRHFHQREKYFTSQPVTTIILVDDIGLRQYHYVRAVDIYFPDGLSKPGALAVADVEGPKG